MKTPLALTLTLEGTQLIEASAGTGKTWTLAVLLVRALLERDLRPAQVLAITFTRAATAEIKSRVLALLHAVDAALSHHTPSGDAAVSGLLKRFSELGVSQATLRARVLRALAEFDDAGVFTIHGFYQRTLKENALATGDLLDAELATNTQAEQQAAARDFWRKELAHYRTLLEVCGDVHSKTLAAALLSYKFPGAKQALFRSPETMASWVKGLLQKAPHAQSEALHLAEQELRAEAKRSAAELAACDLARQQLRAHFSVQLVMDVIEELRRTKQFVSRSYAKHLLPNWLKEIQAWLDSVRFDIQAAPEKLAKYFVEVEFRSALKPTDLALPTSMQQLLQAADAYLAAEKAWQTQLEITHAKLRAWLFSYVAQELPKRLAERGARSADSLAATLAAALQGPRGSALTHSLRARYALVLVDEFQDTDTAQWQVLSEVFAKGGTPLLLVGDPKQAIYRFRGADIAAYLSAKSQAQEVHSLTDNYRSTPQLIAVVNALFAGEGVGSTFGDAAIRYEPVTAARVSLEPHSAQPAAFTVLSFEAPKLADEIKARSIAVAVQHIRGLLEHVSANEIAVLVQTNEEVLSVAAALSRAGIAAAAQRRQAIASSFEALQFQWLLEALIKPFDSACTKRVMITPLWGAKPSEIASTDESAEDAQENDPIAARFAQWSQLAQSKGPAAALERVIRERHTAQRWLSANTMEAEEALARLRQVAEIVQRYTARDGGGLQESLRFLEAWRHGGDEPQLYARLAAPQTLINGEQQDAKLAAPRLASDRAAVQVMTVHASKGLEFDAVVLPLLWAGREPKVATELLAIGQNGMREWRFGPSFDEATRATHAQDEAGELLRVVYVALTRARDHCAVLWPAIHVRDEAQADEPAMKKKLAEKKAEASALGALLGERSWANVSAGFDTYSLNIIEIADDIHANNKDTNADIAIELNSEKSHVTVWPKVPLAWQTSSFSRLQRALAAQEIAQETALEIMAIDDEQSQAELLPGRDEQLALSPARDALIAQALAQRYSFPKGAAAGRCLHTMLEQPRDLLTPDNVAQILKRYGLSGQANAAATAQWLVEIMQAPIALAQGKRVRLSELTPERMQREWEFHLPLIGTDQARLSQALHAAGAQSVNINSETVLLPGFLTGFIDLLFEHEGRYYVVDYKSNHLGNVAQDYSADKLTEAMHAHHYDVQSVLYLLALHRHLHATLKGYVPEQHLGGAVVLFLRGVDADSESGVWSLLADYAALLKLEALICTPA